MAFLDNSGDIILDAVLTDLGREKMASGDFTVQYFALGDDEIDYSLYNKNHPSGSAYYDLVILQTPVLEAFTQTNAAINYGLLQTEATDLLYMPTLAANTTGKVNAGAIVRPMVDTAGAGAGSVWWVTDNSNDTTSLTIIDALEDNTPAITRYFDSTGTGIQNSALFESGLNTTSIKGTAATKATYLLSNNLIDSYYYVHYDNRFIGGVYGPDPGSSLNNATGAGATLVAVAVLATSVTLDLGLANYSTSRIFGRTDAIVYSTSNTVADTEVSSIAGPRGTFTILVLHAKFGLGDEYSQFGGTKTLGSNSIDYIDTTVYLQGVTTGITVQLAVRIARLS